jgi:hypothetical protein
MLVSRGSRCTNATTDHHRVRLIKKTNHHSLRLQVVAQDSREHLCPEGISHHHLKKLMRQDHHPRRWQRELHRNSKVKQCREGIMRHLQPKLTAGSSLMERKTKYLLSAHLSRARLVRSETTLLHLRRLTWVGMEEQLEQSLSPSPSHDSKGSRLLEETSLHHPARLMREAIRPRCRSQAKLPVSKVNQHLGKTSCHHQGKLMEKGRSRGAKEVCCWKTVHLLQEAVVIMFTGIPIGNNGIEWLQACWASVPSCMSLV